MEAYKDSKFFQQKNGLSLLCLMLRSMKCSELCIKRNTYWPIPPTITLYPTLPYYLNVRQLIKIFFSNMPVRRFFNYSPCNFRLFIIWKKPLKKSLYYGAELDQTRDLIFFPKTRPCQICFFHS